MIIIIITRMHAPDLSSPIDEHVSLYAGILTIDRGLETRRGIALSSDVVTDQEQSILFGL